MHLMIIKQWIASKNQAIKSKLTYVFNDEIYFSVINIFYTFMLGKFRINQVIGVNQFIEVPQYVAMMNPFMKIK